MNRRINASVSLDGAVEVEVAPGRLLFDQVKGRQVGAGENVLIHPALVDSWLRNGWCIRREESDLIPAWEPEGCSVEPQSVPATKSARRSRKPAE